VSAARNNRTQRPRRPAPHPQPEFADLSLAEVRVLRADLSAEEERVSYWRRIIQGRIDVVGSERPIERIEGLREMLTPAVSQHHRMAYLGVPSHDMPAPLPDLADLWDREPEPGDEQARGQLVTELKAAEAQLSTYRSELHARLDRVHQELIARYHAEPALALEALPVRR
jgi:hypothetical protein